MTFSLTSEQIAKFEQWKIKQLQKAAEQQLKSGSYLVKLVIKEENGTLIPYEGTIGDSFAFSFVPTSIGMIVRVTCLLTKETINLTDYDNW